MCCLENKNTWHKATACNSELATKEVKVTVHVGTDQNIEIEIFAEYKLTLNELLVTTIDFNTFNSLRNMTSESSQRK